jgi:crotonobetainyl-CoA:carnitine CoA-transferase CaiB-like acyl-CoA transferase
VLAEWGADVIKVEHRRHRDTRSARPAPVPACCASDGDPNPNIEHSNR